MNDSALPGYSSQTPSNGWYESNGSAKFRWWWFFNSGPAGSVFASVIGIPMGAALLWYLAAGKFAPVNFEMSPVMWKAFKTVVSAFIVWIGAILMCKRIASAHGRQGLRFRITDAGLDVHAPMFQHTINWTKVKRVFPNNANEYVIYCTDGMYSFPADQSWSIELFDLIRKRATGGSEQHLAAMHTDPHFLLNMELAIYPLAVALIFQYFRPFINGESLTYAYAGAVTLFAVPLLVVLTGLIYIPYFKVPTILRVGKNELYILDRNGEHIIPRLAISGVRQFGAMVIISAQGQSWFLPSQFIFDPENPVVSAKKVSPKEKLRQYKKVREALLAELKPGITKIGTLESQSTIDLKSSNKSNSVIPNGPISNKKW